MGMFPFSEFGKQMYVHPTIDTHSGFQLATSVSSEKPDCVVTHSLEIMAIMVIQTQNKTDNAPTYVSSKMKQFFAYYKAHYWYTTLSYRISSHRKS